MPLRALHKADGLLHQVTGDDNDVSVLYLPGVHGCWTAMDKARPLLADSFRLIEVAYPLKADWSLHHYAQAVGKLLDSVDTGKVHLIGESFGSLVAWYFADMSPDRVSSHTLVGGLCRAPGQFRAGTARAGLTAIPPFAFNMIVDGYVALKNFQGETRHLHGTKAYPAVRDSRGQKATANRMHLIQGVDIRHKLPGVDYPVRYIGGEKDRVVPVKREIDTLRHALADYNLFDSYLIPDAPHAILASHPDTTVAHIIQWIDEIDTSPGGSIR
ncbi:MAG: alpha/beta hydrolase [Granulosicoccus sp.]|nr:alpha/beta hydrolase [Granulosicoccus sp.]